MPAGRRGRSRDARVLLPITLAVLLLLVFGDLPYVYPDVLHMLVLTTKLPGSLQSVSAPVCPNVT